VKTQITLSKQQGFSLIEVLVAMFVLSIGLLGLAMLQTRGTQFSTESYLRTQVTVSANDIIDRMRANKAGADNGDYIANNAPASPQTCGTSGGCATATDIANYDLTVWYETLINRLPALGSGTPAKIERTTKFSITSDGAPYVYSLYKITINWRERDMTFSQVWDVYI
jgi:type IV pilus assembly protein PilV